MSSTKNSTTEIKIEVARRALQGLADIHKGGSIEPYLDMLTDDYTFYMPLGEFRGKNVGRERAAECYRWVQSMNPKFVYESPHHVTSYADTVVFEFEDHGTLMGKSYHNRIAASFDVRGEKICGYREYMGDIDIRLLADMVDGGENSN